MSERSDKSRQHATPRTDRFDPRCGRDEGKDDALTSWLGIVTISGPDYERLLDHARQLERELAERTDSLVETAAHASKLMDERDSMKVAQSSTTARKSAGNYDPNETPEAKVARLAKVEAFVLACEGRDIVPPSATASATQEQVQVGRDEYLLMRDQDHSVEEKVRRIYSVMVEAKR